MTQAEVEAVILSVLSEGNKTAKEIAPTLGVKPQSLAGTLSLLEARGKIAKNGYQRSHRRDYAIVIWGIARPNEAVEAVRERRLPPPLPAHDSLTAAFFGDPVPGRSALDQRTKSNWTGA